MIWISVLDQQRRTLKEKLLSVVSKLDKIQIEKLFRTLKGV